MSSIAAVNRTQHVGEILVKIEAALQDVFSCYKFGRYGHDVSERLYFLFSHCSHLMFSLWLTDQESGGAVLLKSFPPVAFTAGLDFEGLRYTEYRRRVLHGDSIVEHLKNESKWFAVWMEMLERLDPAGDGCFRKFSERVLRHVEDQTLPERRISRKDRKRLQDLMHEDATARLLLRSVFILEDLALCIVRYLGTLDPKVHAGEQIAAITCLLGQMRRTIVCDTPARGPYVPVARHWRMPVSLALSCRSQTHGLLTVVPTRDGGSIICRYDWPADKEMKSRLWTVTTSVLKRPYEEGLFTTWSYNTGEPLEPAGASTEFRACWTIQKDQAAHLEGLATETEALLQGLQECPACRNLIEAVAGVVRNDGSKWEAGELSWPYIAQLDKVLARLKFICREAKILGGNDPVERAIMQVWPAAGSCPEGMEPAVIEAARRAPVPTA